MNEPEPQHCLDYRAAWQEYCTCFDADEAKRLERRMDQAQKHFSLNEFQVFKKTLPGYTEYWEFLGDRFQSMLDKKLAEMRKGCENCPCGHPAEEHFQCGCLTGCPGGCPACSR